MRKLKIVIKITCFSMLFVFCGKLLQYLLIDDTKSYTRIMMHEFYNQDSNIDVLFVGSSHCYRSLIPEVADKILKKNTFSVGSANQELDGSLAMIKETTKNNDVEEIYLELYYDIAFHEAYKQRSNMTMTYILSDYMQFSMDKVVYLLNASSKEHYINSFILARRNWEKLFEPDYLLELFRKKRTKDYLNYTDTYITNETEFYLAKGYMGSSFRGAKDVIRHEHFQTIDATNISDDWKESLIKIINYCNDNDVKLTLFSAPMPNMLLTDAGNYDDYIDFVKELIEVKGKNVRYYDFNLCKEEYIPNDNTLFKDSNHLNYYGAELFSKVFSEFFTGQISEEELFYDSYEEKLQCLSDDVFGVVVQEDKEKCFITIEPVTNANINEITYEAIKHTEGKESLEIYRGGVQNLPQIGYKKGETGIFEIVIYLSGEEKSRVRSEYGEL